MTLPSDFSSPTGAPSDDYVREKLAEAQADVEQRRVAEWNLEEIRIELRQRRSEVAS